MDEKRKIYKPKPISGFPEWLPEYRAVEQRWLDHIRRVFESYGYTNIETPAVEEVDVLTAKGEVDKEIYVLERLQKDENDKSDARLALHFDQTVPLARYVAQHFADLNFPFKRYQMQKVWRGERPQLGREREFYQCDIDVIGIDTLPLHFDAEMPAAIYECLAGLDIGGVQIRISNRKILLGLLAALNVADAVAVTRTIDKIEKIGEAKVRSILKDDVGLSESIIDQVLALSALRATPQNTKPLSDLHALNDTMKEGITELKFVLDNLAHLPDGAILGDLSIVRGLDYYTGTVYEAKLLDCPDFTRAAAGGGRYDDLASGYINKKLPGVGLSIGLTCIFEVLHHYGHIKPGRKCPTDVLVTLPSEERRADAAQTAQALRARGMNVELFHKAAKTGDQIAYANKKGIPFVWFPPFEASGAHEVKDMATGLQTPADASTWTPTK